MSNRERQPIQPCDRMVVVDEPAAADLDREQLRALTTVRCVS